MRKYYQSFKRLLTGQEGSMAPAAVAAAIVMLFIILGVSEYMRLVITQPESKMPWNLRWFPW